jgi:hypothetical protein
MPHSDTLIERFLEEGYTEWEFLTPQPERIAADGSVCVPGKCKLLRPVGSTKKGKQGKKVKREETNAGFDTNVDADVKGEDADLLRYAEDDDELVLCHSSPYNSDRARWNNSTWPRHLAMHFGMLGFGVFFVCPAPGCLTTIPRGDSFRRHLGSCAMFEEKWGAALARELAETGERNLERYRVVVCVISSRVLLLADSV